MTRTPTRADPGFLRAASHELRQPLLALGLLAQSLQDRVAGPAAETAQRIVESVDALDSLLVDLARLATLESGQSTARACDVPLASLFDRLQLQFEPQALEQGLKLRFRGGQTIARVDPVLLEGVLRNLLSNALRFTDRGGVLVSARRRQNALQIRVWDSGIGIADEHQARIFEPFFRAAPSSQRPGSGLGLSFAWRWAQMAGSTLQVRSAPGQGSVFELLVPEAEAPTVAAAVRDGQLGV